MLSFVFRGCAAAVALGVSGVAQAADVDLATGSGSDYAELVVHFADDEDVTFGVTFDAAVEAWSGESFVYFVADATGGRLLDGTDAGFIPPADFGQLGGLDLVFKTFAFGSFFDGFGYGGRSDLGFGGGDDFWHLWEGTTTSTTPTGWSSASVGASDIAVVDQTAIGFRYGSALAPLEVPEPGTLGLVLCSGLMLNRRRHHR